MSRQTASRKFWELRRKDAGDEVVLHEPFAAHLPRVNLLPAGFRDAILAARIRRWIVYAGVAILALGAIVWFMQGQAISQAVNAVDRAQADNAALQAKQAQLAPVSDLFAQISRQKKFVQDTLAAQPEAAQVIRHLLRSGGEVQFTTLSVAYRGIPAPGEPPNECPNPNPFDDKVAIGCLEFSATAKDRAQVSELLLALESDPFFIGPYVSNTTSGGDGGVITFTGSAAISTDALVTPLSPEQIDAILAPTPAPSASPGATP